MSSVNSPRFGNDAVVYTQKVTYDFDVHGGAVGDIALDCTVPDNAVILDGIVDVLTPPTSGGAATVALKVEGAADLLGATAIASVTGLVDTVPNGTAANAIKTTADRVVTVTVAVAALTAGKMNIFFRYFISE